jgi:hypothetical protein
MPGTGLKRGLTVQIARSAASPITLFLLAMVPPVAASAAISKHFPLSSGKWVNASLPRAEARRLRITYDANPSASSVDAATGLSSGPIQNFANLAAIARFDTNSKIDARNGSTCIVALVIRYSTRITYYFALDVNIATHIYNPYVMLGSKRTTYSVVTAVNHLTRKPRTQAM